MQIWNNDPTWQRFGVLPQFPIHRSGLVEFCPDVAYRVDPFT